MNLDRRIEGIWYHGRREPLLAGLLAGAAVPYRLALGIREGAFRTGMKKIFRPPVPCISVGNLVVGGTGKTPVVSWIVTAFLEAGRKPAVISRGYGRSAGGVEIVGGVSHPAVPAARYGDEPVLLARRHPGVPVVVAADRRIAAERAVREGGADILVADDAFQHRVLGRDLDIVVVDASRLFGNERLFPHGPLREGTAALRRADIILLNRIAGAPSVDGARERLDRLASGKPIVYADVVAGQWSTWGESERELPSKPRRVSAFCGIAQPGSFRESLATEGVGIAAFRAFTDHHRYRESELAELAAEAERLGVEAVVTTAKDAARIASWPGSVPLAVLHAELVIRRGEKRLREALLSAAGGNR